MARSRRASRLSASRSDTSASTSPERGLDDDNDSLMLQANDSLSSLAPSVSLEYDEEAMRREIEERCRRSPISRLPAELMISIFSKLSSSGDLKNCMLVSKEWARNSVGLLWHRPQTNKWGGLKNVISTVRKVDGFFDYATLVKRLNLSALGNEVSDGTLQPLSLCKRVERLTLTGCTKLSDLSLTAMLKDNHSLLALDITGLESVTDKTMQILAENCVRLQGLNITNCKKITDESLEVVAQRCRHVKRLKFNGCSQLTDKSILAFAMNCRYLLEIDLHDCKLLEDESITTLIAEGPHLRELRLAHCHRLTDNAFIRLPNTTYDSLRILDLTDCIELQDWGIQKAVHAAPRLRNLVLAKCRNLTDRAVLAITHLGKNLHYIHLGHCSRITDAGVLALVKACNRIRYIDLACCSNLTDNSVKELAMLPKLKRIGLVKCGNITDRSILALAKPKMIPGHTVAVIPSALERVHLSYCTNLTLSGIHALLNNCPRLTHLSLTGVQAFLREDLVMFCREAPLEFNDHQRDVFCVFSGLGVTRLREHLNRSSRRMPSVDGETMYDETEEPEMNDVTHQANGMSMEEGEEFGEASEMMVEDEHQNF
ncbi:RNI-like protein [Delitschia confertaspora ATCC 74209]|uniref:RNI-like protein n=1 Tax=Delitschia confertaspora ATCC 74209 TaxID=1513339 RepID=A0A9P4JDG4_9PLEO|nr:RNI-like protein [Delitschia confertaspora ATCC 74209]